MKHAGFLRDWDTRRHNPASRGTFALLGTVTADIGLRERKKNETRAALSRAALDLALRDGYDAVTIDAIAAAANVSTRTFRNYFSSKEDAVLALLFDVDDHLTRTLQGRDDAEPVLDSLEACALDLIAAGDDFDRAISVTRMMVEHPALIAHAAAAHHRSSERTIAEISRRMGQGSAGIAPRLLYHASRGVLAAVVESIAAGSATHRAAALVSEGFELLRAGLG